MIVYESNRFWVKDMVNFTRSYTMKKIVFGVGLIGSYTALVCFVYQFYGLESNLHSGIYSLLGIILSILLVFRTNTAYDRWWEGRKQWGALVNNCRNYAIMVESLLPENDKDTRKFFAKHIANFCIALRDHLRDGVRTDALLMLSSEELNELEPKKHKPNHISLWLNKKMVVLQKSGVLSEADAINMKIHHNALLDILGACERIKKTPIPFSYAVHIKLFITIYGVMLPYGMIADFGYHTIGLVMVIFFALLGLELMAEEVEEPFGIDCNDLPTGDIAHNIKNNVFEILLDERPLKEDVKRELYEKVH
ncbi:MAG: bestrophin family ion channel [Imperialibacter sp.]|uniref:bestrophin family protein n=1 Tax=Imperialibacter sp. TaxID=2038411 RepID=UPI0032EB0319